MADKDVKTAVLINLKKNGELREDLYDAAAAWKRTLDPRESLAAVRARLTKN